jgi:hypothetical protein
MDVQFTAFQYLEQIVTPSPGVKMLLLDQNTFAIPMTRTAL